jgi:glycosyltransferase involved in cell wall biosynthesis
MGAPARNGLRVLQVMECTIGGTRRHITDVARGLSGRGVDVHLAVATHRQPDFRETLQELAKEGCTVHEIPMRRAISPVADVRQIVALQKLLREVQPQVVHTHSSKAGVLGRLASHGAGIGKRVHTPHTFAFLFRQMFQPTKRRLFFELEKQLAQMSHALVAVSASEARTFRRSGVVAPDKVHVVPNGINAGSFGGSTNLSVSEFGLDPRRPTAAIIGLLNKAKGQDLAIESLMHRPELDELQLLIVGHGEMESDLRALTRARGLEQRVAFAGFRQDVPEILLATDFVLLPSRWEGMPYIVLEAMAASRGVAATPVDGAVDLIEQGHTGWLAPMISSAAIADTLVRVLEHSPEQRVRMGQAARARVEASFTDEIMVDRLLELYASILPSA